MRDHTLDPTATSLYLLALFLHHPEPMSHRSTPSSLFQISPAWLSHCLSAWAQSASPQFKFSDLKVNFRLLHSSILHTTIFFLQLSQFSRKYSYRPMERHATSLEGQQMSSSAGITAARGTKAGQHYWNTKPIASASNKLQFIHKLHVSESLS